MKKTIFFMMILLLFFMKDGVATPNNLIQSLEEALFSDDGNIQPLYQYISCKDMKIDSSISVREQQPNAEKVLKLLKEIIHTEEGTSFPMVQDIYLKQIDYFNQEWAKAYASNFYACDQIQEQFNILRGFETALRVLDFKKQEATMQQVFNYYIEEKILNYALIGHTQEWSKLISKYHVYSEDFRRINSKAWLGGRIPFSYLDPFLKELEPFFIDMLNECDWDENPKSQKCMAIWFSHIFYTQISDPQIANYFINHLENWERNYRHSFIFDYAGRHFYPELTHRLVEQWMKDDPEINKPLYRQHTMRLLLYQQLDNNLPIVLDKLLDTYGQQAEYNNSLLKYLPYLESLDILENRLKDTDQKATIQLMITQLNQSHH